MAESLRTLTAAELDQVSGGADADGFSCGTVVPGYHIVGPRPITELAAATQKLAVNVTLTAAVGT